MCRWRSRPQHQKRTFRPRALSTCKLLVISSTGRALTDVREPSRLSPLHHLFDSGFARSPLKPTVRNIGSGYSRSDVMSSSRAHPASFIVSVSSSFRRFSTLFGTAWFWTLPEVHDAQKEIDTLNNHFRRSIGMPDEQETR